MPTSIDISSYEKALVLEESYGETGSLSSSDGGDDTTPMLEKAEGTTKRKSRRCQLTRSPWLFLLDAGLVVVVLLVFKFFRTSTSGPQLLGDVAGYVPQFSEEVTMFRAHPEFISNHTSLESLKEARQAWIDFLPRGQGYLRIEDSDLKNFDLPDPVNYKGSQSLGTSWMHGLHCLYVIMSEYDMLKMGMRKPDFDTWHMDHCIDYVRQLITCGGDMALAGGDIPGGSSFLDVPHVCKNYGEMHAYLEKHRDNDAYQFGSHATHFVPP